MRAQSSSFAFLARQHYEWRQIITRPITRWHREPTLRVDGDEREKLERLHKSYHDDPCYIYLHPVVPVSAVGTDNICLYGRGPTSILTTTTVTPRSIRSSTKSIATSQAEYCFCSPLPLATNGLYSGRSTTACTSTAGLCI
jgi:hypothetical protein